MRERRVEEVGEGGVRCRGVDSEVSDLVLSSLRVDGLG